MSVWPICERWRIERILSFIMGFIMTWDYLLSPVGSIFPTWPEELDLRRAGEPVPLYSTCGGGLNSVAGLVLLRRLGIRPDAIVFADTGGEQPATYTYLTDVLGPYLAAAGFPPVTTVRYTPDEKRTKYKYTTLEEECLAKSSLPSTAYGLASCSDKWKRRPQRLWCQAWPPAVDAWSRGNRVLQAIYFEAGEEPRNKPSDPGYANWYPLQDYGWGREECVAAIRLEGLPVPPKSSCFFCPDMTPREVIQLGIRHPDLLDRALAIEKNNRYGGSILGLGRDKYSWADIASGAVLPETVRATKCSACYDG